MEQSSFFLNFTILLVAAFVGGMIAHRLKQPIILGYLIIGSVVGPYAFKLVNDVSVVQISANMGVALLMLTLGLEVPFTQLKEVGKVGLLGGVLQIVVTSALGYFAGIFMLHWSVTQSILFGLIISLSSTTVCLKILMDRGELDSIHGRIMMTVLILQDIASILMIIAVPLLGQAQQNIWLVLGRTLGGSILFIAIAIVAGLWVLPWLMGRVGGIRSRELFILSVLVLCLGAALGTQIFGLSAIFGAFLIGLVLRETRFAHQALAEITPLRDIFAALFFVSLGMLLDPGFIFYNWGIVLITIALIFFIKFAIVFGIVRGFGYSLGISLFAGLGLFQIGEFSFIIAQSGANLNILSNDMYSLIIGSAVITMLLTPFSIGLASRLQARFSRLPEISKSLAAGKPSPNFEPEETGDVVIAGFGRVGQNVARGLQEAGIRFSIIETDPEVVYRTRCDGKSCIYGDAGNIHVLAQLDLNKASLFIVTFPDPVAVFNTARTVLSINPELKVIARAHRERDADRLKKMGVTELISPEYLTSLEFIRKVLNLIEAEVDIRNTMKKVLNNEEVEKFEPDEENR
jgi:monovalent cation:H+ antiporter-2, CPA2 family